MKFYNTSICNPEIEYRSGGFKISRQVIAVDNDGEMYIARRYESSGSFHWKEEDISGTNAIIPNVYAWAEKPKINFE